jgi:predicted lipopolysaccharide heptosyltransferase III
MKDEMPNMVADSSISQNKLRLSAFKNILLVQLGDIGDVVLTTPTIRTIKISYPDAKVSILVSKPYGSLLQADPYIYNIIEVSRYSGNLLYRLRKNAAFARQLRQAHYDLVIDLRTGDHGAILAFLTGAAVRVGSPGNSKQFWRKFVFTKILSNIKSAPPPTHPGADQSLRILRAIGIDTPDTKPRLFVTSQDRARAEELLKRGGLTPESRWITINPFSRWKYKEWDKEKWGETVDRLWEIYKLPAVLIGAPEETAECLKICIGREGRAISLAGKTTLGELAAVISMSALHLGVDSAAPHIAAALGRPTVTIHGPTDWRAWRIVNDIHRIVEPSMHCVPCSKMGCNDSGISKCLADLGTDEVIEVVENVLSQNESL